MVTMINYVPLDLNDFDPRRDDAEVTVTVGSLGGFEVLLRRSGPAAWRRVMPDRAAGGLDAVEVLVGQHRGVCYLYELNEPDSNRSIRIVHA